MKQVEIAAVVLAAGFSNRMGAEKLLLPFRGKPMIQWTLDRIDQLPFDRQLLVCQSKEVANSVPSDQWELVWNRKAYLGQSASVHAAVRHTGTSVTGWLFFPGDQPLLERAGIVALIQTIQANPSCIVRPVYGAQPGAPVYFPVDLMNELMSITGDTGGRIILQAHEDRVIDVALPEHMGIDIDTPESLRRWEQALLRQ